MHRLARRLIYNGPYADTEMVEKALQGALGYSARKALAKYLDEFNVVREAQADRLAPGAPVS